MWLRLQQGRRAHGAVRSAPTRPWSWRPAWSPPTRPGCPRSPRCRRIAAARRSRSHSQPRPGPTLRPPTSSTLGIKSQQCLCRYRFPFPCQRQQTKNGTKMPILKIVCTFTPVKLKFFIKCYKEVRMIKTELYKTVLTMKNPKASAIDAKWGFFHLLVSISTTCVKKEYLYNSGLCDRELVT